MIYKKELGQNFLTNKATITKFIHFCNLNLSDTVLEIGSGNGSLSTHIATKVNKVIGIELDPFMAREIEKLLINNYEVRIENFLDLNLRQLINDEKITKIIGAIPYYISSPIIHKIIKESTEPLKEVYLITQKEFAEKVIGKKDKRGYFTNLVEKYGNIEKGAIIKKEDFNPQPKVDSLYFKFQINNYPENINEVEKWSKFLHHVFSTPRKKINKRFTKEVLNQLAIDENLRPENLSIPDIEKIYNLTNS